MNPFSRRFSFWLPLLALALSLGVGCGARTPLEAGGGGGDDFDAGDSPPPVDAGMRPDVEILDAAVCGGECGDEPAAAAAEQWPLEKLQLVPFGILW